MNERMAANWPSIHHPPLSSRVHPLTLTHLSYLVALKYFDEVKGRGVIAKRNIEEGEVVFTEAPLAASLTVSAPPTRHCCYSFTYL